jgi:hypothetical protein
MSARPLTASLAPPTPIRNGSPISFLVIVPYYPAVRWTTHHGSGDQDRIGCVLT